MGYVRRIGLGASSVVRPRYDPRSPKAPLAPTAPRVPDLDPRPNVTVRDYRKQPSSGVSGLKIRIPTGLVTALTPQPAAAPVPVVVTQAPPGPPAAPPKTSSGSSGGSGGAGAGGQVTTKPPITATQGPSELPDWSGGASLPMNTILIMGGAAVLAYLILRRSS